MTIRGILNKLFFGSLTLVLGFLIFLAGFLVVGEIMQGEDESQDGISEERTEFSVTYLGIVSDVGLVIFKEFRNSEFGITVFINIENGHLEIATSAPAGCQFTARTTEEHILIEGEGCPTSASNWKYVVLFPSSRVDIRVQLGKGQQPEIVLSR